MYANSQSTTTFCHSFTMPSKCASDVIETVCDILVRIVLTWWFWLRVLVISFRNLLLLRGVEAAATNNTTFVCFEIFCAALQVDHNFN